MSLLVVKPGLLTTIQDLGRPGWSRYGVSPSGALDPLAAAAANRLCGNAPGAALLEITGPGATLRVEVPTTVAIAGADLHTEVASGSAMSAPTAGATRVVHPFSAAQLAAGDVVRFVQRRSGARAYFAVAGGLDVPRVFGSVATDLGGHIGGKPLTAGQRIPLGPRGGEPKLRTAFQLASWYADPPTLRVIAASATPPEVTVALAAHTYVVSPRSNRAGYFLDGPPLPVSMDANALSEPIAPGAIQVPPDGRPILLLADRQTVGGYPVVAHLAAVDTPKAAQLWPGDHVRFVPIAIEEAQAALRAQHADVDAIDVPTAAEV